ncbi:MAG: cytochrome c maturation protein CcmE [Gammaproteobacteria bacterium]|nr:cytochrome c maturation protein CcmE [Gammaproteobacteria bacterium]
MTPRRQRLMVAIGVLAGVGIAATLALRAFEDNLLYFYTPSQIAAGEAPPERRIRLGGLVRKGSINRLPGEIEMRFIVADASESMTVAYSGVVPDLFREGQGVIAFGVIGPDGVFRADELLAKHDENYMPPEVAEALREQGHPDAPPAVTGGA